MVQVKFFKEKLGITWSILAYFVPYKSKNVLTSFSRQYLKKPSNILNCFHLIITCSKLNENIFLSESYCKFNNLNSTKFYEAFPPSQKDFLDHL